MGYACPVCETPQTDAVHLANHLGFTAVARGGEHETWLDEHVPDWGSLDDEALADAVVEHADEADFPQVFEDTTGQHHDHGNGHGRGDGHGRKQRRSQPGGIPGTEESLEAALDRTVAAGEDLSEAEREEILEAARDLTRQRREESETE